MQTIEFLFDPISPYAWLAWSQIDQFEKRNGVQFRYKPVLLAALLNASGNKGPAETPSKRAYTMKDAMRWAIAYGLPFEGPPAHPFNPLKALRLIAAVEDEANRARVSGLILEGTWAKGYDVTSDVVLEQLACEAGLDGKELLARTEESAIKDRVKSNTQCAIDRGVFGVPSFLVGDEIFWGNDRLGLVELHLRARLVVDETQYRKVLARPRAADRSGVAK